MQPKLFTVIRLKYHCCRGGFFLAFFLLGFVINTNAQTKCNCPEYDKLSMLENISEADEKAAIEKLKSSNNIICNAKYFEWYAIDFLGNKNYDTAEIYLQSAEKLYKKSGCSDSVLLDTYKQWAQLNYTKAEFAKSLDYSLKMLQSAENSGNSMEIAVCNTMIAQLFNQMGQAEKGIVYTRKAIPLLKKISSPDETIKLLFLLTKRYLWHYQDTKTTSSLDTSELLTYQLLDLAKKNNNKSYIAKAFTNLEGVAWEKEDYKKALQYIDSSFKYTAKDDYNTLATNYFDKADLYLELKDYPAAHEMADSALYCYTKSGSVIYIADSYDQLSRISKEQGDYKQAFEYKELARNITDSLRNVKKTKEITELEKKYHQAKNEKKITELAQQKRIYLLLALAGLLALVGLVFFIRQQALKSKQRILETEQRLNRARMNPHFFFNALSSLQSFALTENDGKAMASNLSKFSHIMRETLESSYKDYVTIEQEMDFLSEYLELQKMRFPQKFTYELMADDNIEPHELLIPSMIIQPFAENSIEHGFSNIDYPGQLLIQFSKLAKEIKIEVSDNGAGFGQVTKNTEGHISRASQIIKDRIYLLNIKLKTNARFSIENHPTGKGIMVQIFLPEILQNENTNN